MASRRIAKRSEYNSNSPRLKQDQEIAKNNAVTTR
jgi:hypothetical protein